MESVYNGSMFLLQKVIRKILLIFRKICSRRDVKKKSICTNYSAKKWK